METGFLSSFFACGSKSERQAEHEAAAEAELEEAKRKAG